MRRLAFSDELSKIGNLLEEIDLLLLVVVGEDGAGGRELLGRALGEGASLGSCGIDTSCGTSLGSCGTSVGWNALELIVKWISGELTNRSSRGVSNSGGDTSGSRCLSVGNRGDVTSDVASSGGCDTSSSWCLGVRNRGGSTGSTGLSSGASSGASVGVGSGSS
jgi:hypothetical protein